MTTAEDILRSLGEVASAEQSMNLSRFFKTGPGQYGEGDLFLGVKVPQNRAIVKAARLDVGLHEIEKLLYSPWHEARLAGLLLLVEEMKAARKSPERQREIAGFYIRHSRQANNWDLVDLSCPYILGAVPEAADLRALAGSDNLWQQRIAIVTTLAFVRRGEFSEALAISAMLLTHSHDLIHKAVGWVLREIGKKDGSVLRDFLRANYRQLPRTTLRYAIERFPEQERRQWLCGPR